MPVSFVRADSLLALDVGTVTTRASLFDVVDARYRYLGSGEAPSTVNAPYHDLSEGVHQAIQNLQQITGRNLIDAEAKLIVPSNSDGSGVDLVVATVSAGPPLKVILVGLLPDVSLESARHLLSTTVAQLLDQIHLGDHRNLQERLNLILKTQPDLVVVSGGTEGGAEKAVLQMLEAVGLASLLSNEEARPQILYVGNSAIHPQVKSALGSFGTLILSANIRPTLEVEQLDGAKLDLMKAFRKVRGASMPGFYELDQLAGGGVIPPSFGWERVVRMLSKAYDQRKGVMGVDLGASATIIAAGLGGNSTVGVFPQYGLANQHIHNLELVSTKDIAYWLTFEMSAQAIKDILLTKQTYPASLPMNKEELEVEHALARLMLQYSLRDMRKRFNQFGGGELPVLPPLEPIIAAGSVLTRAPRWSQAAMVLLDGLQPTRVTTLVLDQHHISALLGAVAAINPVLAVQAMDFGTLLNLASVIAPLGHARPGTVVLKAKLIFEDGREEKMEFRYGNLYRIPLPFGQTLQLHLQPLHGFDLGMGGAGIGGKVRLSGSALGAIIDVRGRPLPVIRDAKRRQDWIRRNLAVLETQ
ncbi:MAG: glutamate mutase L [Anaerolineales bacterium]